MYIAAPKYLAFSAILLLAGCRSDINASGKADPIIVPALELRVQTPTTIGDEPVTATLSTIAIFSDADATVTDIPVRRSLSPLLDIIELFD